MAPSMDMLFLIAALVACGVVAGILAGLLGVGGGIIVVPMLYYVFSSHGIAPNTAMHLSVGTSLSTIVLTSWVSARNHHRCGSVDWSLVRGWVPTVLIGVVAGIALAHSFSGLVVKSLFGALLMAVSVHMLISARQALSVFDRLPDRPAQTALGVLVGGASSLLGIGGGTLMVPLLSLYSYPIHRAVATSSVFGFVISVPATLGYVINGWHVPGIPNGSSGYVNWSAFAALVPATMLCAPLGVKLAYRLNVSQLKRAFAFFLFAVGLKMAFL
jgi:uncharacterized membrane protein YfcA